MGLFYANDVMKPENADEYRVSMGVVAVLWAFLYVLGGSLCI